MNTKEIVASLIKSGAKEVKDLTIKNVTITTSDEYVRVALTLDKEVNGYRVDDDGTFKLGKTNIIFSSTYAISAIFKENDDLAFAANHIVKNPDALAVILSRATISILQEEVISGEEYKNPFAGENGKVTVFDHDAIINHIVDIKLSSFGSKQLDKLVDLMLGFK